MFINVKMTNIIYGSVSSILVLPILGDETQPIPLPKERLSELSGCGFENYIADEVSACKVLR